MHFCVFVVKCFFCHHISFNNLMHEIVFRYVIRYNFIFVLCLVKACFNFITFLNAIANFKTINWGFSGLYYVLGLMLTRIGQSFLSYTSEIRIAWEISFHIDIIGYHLLKMRLRDFEFPTQLFGSLILNCYPIGASKK